MLLQIREIFVHNIDMKKRFYLRIKLVLILFFCFFVFHTNLFAKDSGDISSLAKIESISPVLPKYKAGEKITFVGTFRDPAPTDEYSIAWDFGDGNIYTGTLTTSKDIYANPSRCSPYKNICYSKVNADTIYSKPGSYTVTFSVTNSKGTKHEDSKMIIVEENSNK